ncbi:MAG: GTPase ObgE [Paenibacillaceae bacterium]
MFLDKAKIYVKGGNGGDGIVSYRRELYVPMGGPAGGDGGRGGDVIFVVDSGLRTLIDFRYQKHFKAPIGERGKNKSRHGANAEDMIVRVPPGTVVLDEDSGEILADLTRHGQQVVVAKGGRGGRGNIRFATPANPAPGISENGEEGKERYLILELKVMADVGLVGFPSVGKSTLLSVVSAATPKIGAYHFTTITPNLGVVDVGDGRSFVMADLPGLIEGANEGVGLGHEFLRHIERTRVLVHIIDMSAVDGRDPYEDWVMINRELELYNPLLLTRPQLLVANKMDSPGADVHLEAFKERLIAEGEQTEVLPISAVTKDGIQQVLYRCADILETIPNVPSVEEVKDVSERKVYQAEEKKDESYEIRRENDLYIIESPHIENMLKRMNFNTQEAADRFARIMSKMGIDKALRLKGAKDGNYVRIGEFEFEFVDQE